MKIIPLLIGSVSIALTVGCGALDSKSPADLEILPNALESEAKEALEANGIAFATDPNAPGGVEDSGPLSYYWNVKGKTRSGALSPESNFTGNVAYDDPSTPAIDKPRYRRFAFKKGKYDCVKIQAWGRPVSRGYILGTKNAWIDLNGGTYRGCGSKVIRAFKIKETTLILAK